MQSVPIAATTIGDLVDGAAADSDGDAVVFPGERVTFPELADLTDGFARSLRGLEHDLSGHRPHDARRRHHAGVF